MTEASGELLCRRKMLSVSTKKNGVNTRDRNERPSTRRDSQTKPTGSPLTEREKEVLRLVAEDLTQKDIADRLGISIRTVEFHLHSIKERTGVHGIVGMVRYAIRSGIIDP
jgi:DNA-binding CsgD family transcriptional regulator